jgi:hypothetical protein
LRLEPDQPTPLFQRIISGEESAISIKQMCRHPAFMRDGRPMAIGRGYRIVRRPGRGGVLLESAVIGGQLVVTEAAITRYLTALNDPCCRPAARSYGPTPKQLSTASKRAHHAALAELRRAGLVVS